MLKNIQKTVHFVKNDKSWTPIIIFCILVGFILIYFLFFRHKLFEFFENKPAELVKRDIQQPYKTEARGFCHIDDDYILPVMHPDFVSPDEAIYILQKAGPEFSESKVVTGNDVSIRKSKTAWLPNTDPVVSTIIRRVCAMTNIPFENSEKMQVVQYEADEYYNEHHDSCCDDRIECVEFEKNGGQRKVTMLIYLSDDFEGGSTRFINLDQDYKPPKFSGLLFHSLQKDGNKGHPLALHAGLPVKSGRKYIANVWLREREYDTR